MLQQVREIPNTRNPFVEEWAESGPLVQVDILST
jgi:hypothetical protein